MKNMRRGGAGLAALMATGLALAACGANDTSTSGDGPDVLASFYPLAFASEWVAGPDANVTNLTQPGVEAHDLELTARQVGRIVEAELIVYLRGFQPAVDDAIDQNAEGAMRSQANSRKAAIPRMPPSTAIPNPLMRPDGAPFGALASEASLPTTVSIPI